MTLSYDGKKLPTIKFLVLPIFMIVIISSGIIWGVLTARGNDLLAIYIFNNYFRILLSTLGFLSFISIMFAVGNVGPGNRQNMLVFLNLAVMFGAIGTIILSLTVWDKKPKAVLDDINLKLSPVIEEFFAQKSIKPLELSQNPKAPYAIIDASMIVDSNGNYFFTKPELVEGESPSKYLNTYAQNLHLLEIVQSGALPESYQSIVVVVRQWVKTGRNIHLDLGSVPELRQQVNIYIIDIASWQVVSETGPIFGSRAHRPIGGPGAGTIYVKELRGKEVKVKTIYRTLDKITWE